MSLYSPYEKKEKNQQVQQNSQNKDNNSSAPSSIKHQEQNNVHQLQPSNFTYQTYTPSVTVQQAQDLLQQQMKQKPGQYQSTWKGQLNDTINQILNRNKFSYDVNGDALYQQYKDQYVQQGKLAMMDTMGQAAALTGGYGNTYGQSVGQQAYQAYLQQLNEVVPELYGMALDQYNQEGQALYDQAALMAQQEDQDYSRYMDGLNAYLTERDYLTGRYDTERDYDYGKWADGRDFSYGQFIDDRNMGYQQERDRIADERYQQELAYQQEQDRIAQEQWQKEYDFSMQQYLDSQKAKSTSGSGSGGSSGNGGKGNSGLTYNQMLELEEKVGNWAEKGVDYLNTQLSYWVSKYGLDADYAADLLMYYFPDEFKDIIDTSVAPLSKKGGAGGSGVRQVHMLN